MSAPRDDGVFLIHIREAIERIQLYLDEVDESSFLPNQLLQDGVIRQLEIIGEAAKRLSSEFRATHADVPWPDIIGMRAKLAHDYMAVDLQAVWDTATNDVPSLKSKLVPRTEV